MKKLKEKVLKTIILLTVVSSTLPFFCHDLYADTVVPVVYNSQSTQSQWSSHLHVTNYCESPLQGSTPCKLTFTLDDNYYGMIGFDGYAGTTLALSYVTVFVTGGIGEYNYRTFSNANPMYINSINIMGVGLTIPDSSVDLTLIEQLLTSINNYSNQINSNVDILTEMKIWDIPFESISAISYSLNKGYPIYQFQQYNDYQFPMFEWTYNDTLYEFISATSTGYNEFYMIILANVTYSTSGYNTNLKLTDGSYTNSQTLFQFRLGANNSDVWRIVKLTIGNFTTTTADNTITFKSQSMNLKGCVLYFGSTTNQNISTEFALQFGLSNQLLNDVHQIAQGTQQSNSSSSDLEDNASDFDDVAGDVYNLENSFNTDLNNSLQSIDTSFDVGNTFGSKFLLAADWVRVQFNTITASNPFGTMLSFSLLLGVALLIIGKVLG